MPYSLVKALLKLPLESYLSQPLGQTRLLAKLGPENAEACAEMILAVETDQLAHMTAETAAEIWTELERVHRARGLATRLALCRKFSVMKKKKGRPMSQWIADVRNVAFRLRAIEVKIDDEDLVLILSLIQHLILEKKYKDTNQRIEGSRHEYSPGRIQGEEEGQDIKIVLDSSGRNQV